MALLKGLDNEVVRQFGGLNKKKVDTRLKVQLVKVG